MKILLAGGAGVVGRTLIPLLTQAGHTVFATSRDAGRASTLTTLGAEPIVMDALDRASVFAAVAHAEPDAVIAQLTDLAELDYAGNARLRIIGTRNLVDAAREGGSDRLIAQSISWVVAPGMTPATEQEPLAKTATPGVAELESAVAEIPGGVILRYGLLYGPGTWFAPDGLRATQARAGTLPERSEVVSFVHVDDAAHAALEALGWPAGIVNIVDDEPAHATEWMPTFARAVGAPPPTIPQPRDSGRPISNALARSRGWEPGYPSWRTGFETLSQP
jgi:nucleoside-diphosphate-sugar epimerase